MCQTPKNSTNSTNTSREDAIKRWQQQASHHFDFEIDNTTMRNTKNIINENKNSMVVLPEEEDGFKKGKRRRTCFIIVFLFMGLLVLLELSKFSFFVKNLQHHYVVKSSMTIVDNVAAVVHDDVDVDVDDIVDKNKSSNINSRNIRGSTTTGRNKTSTSSTHPITNPLSNSGEEAEDKRLRRSSQSSISSVAMPLNETIHAFKGKDDNEDDGQSRSSISLAAAKAVEEDSIIVTFPPEKVSEWMDDIHLTTTYNNKTNTKVACGAFKCAFPSKAYFANDSNIIIDGTTQKGGGYLVSQSPYHKLKKGKNYDSLLMGYQLAKSLERKYKIRHLMLDAPHEFDLSEEFATTLNSQQLYNPSHNSDKIVHYEATTATVTTERNNSEDDTDDEDDEDNMKKEQQQLKLKKSNTNKLIIQPIQFMSSDTTVMFKCKDSRKMKQIKNQLQSKAKRIFNNDTMTTAFVDSNSSDYAKQLIGDYNSTIRMLHSKAGNCLFADFQILIDIHEGKIYHIDIDRCFDTEGGKKFKKRWLDGNPLYKNCILHMLREVYMPIILKEWKRSSKQAAAERKQQQIQQ